MKDNKWSVFLMSLGFLFIATSPNLDNPTINIIMGALIVCSGFLLLKRNKKG